MSKKRDTNIYELFDGNKKVYIGVSDDPSRREQEHKDEGKKFTNIRIVGPKLTKESAFKRESERISQYQKDHKGKNPKYNNQD